MIEFGGENKEINKKSKTAPFLLSLQDGPDNTLRIVIAFPMEGDEAQILTTFQSSMRQESRICWFDPGQYMKIWSRSTK